MTMILAMFLGVFGIDEVVSGLAGATTIDGALLRIDAFLHSLVDPAKRHFQTTSNSPVFVDSSGNA
ncbi:hypothetical protein, partial [Marinobacter shengliensis]